MRNGVARGATPDSRDASYKLADVANSRVVILTAPTGVGEDVDRWNAFLDLPLLRTTTNGTYAGGAPRTYGAPTQVRSRDQVAIVGGNDGLLHAFLAGRAESASPMGETTYAPIGTRCPVGTRTKAPQAPQTAMCDGLELWGYSPRFLQPQASGGSGGWTSLRGGHFFMVDGTPVVSDVLFTKGSAVPGPVCATSGCPGWEYRTVLVECMGAGGPGCFALDVTNPWQPQVLWERELTAIPGKSTATSQPQIARVARDVGGTAIPYWVVLMGAGADSPGHFLAIGLEDGVVASTLDSATPAADASFAGAPTCLDADNDSFIDTCYVLSEVGSVYKVRIGTAQGYAPIVMEKFFDPRPILGPVTVRARTKVVAAAEPGGGVSLFYATGDVDDVQNAGEQNYVFKLRDVDPAGPLVPFDATNSGTGNPWNVDRAAGSCSGTPGGGMTRIGPSPSGIFALAAGEKVLFDPIISNGTVLFTSFAPDQNGCLPGAGYLYGARFDTCAPGFTDPPRRSDGTRIGVTKKPIAGPPTAPVLFEAKGVGPVAGDRSPWIGAGLATAAKSRPPLMKLWWREVLF